MTPFLASRRTPSNAFSSAAMVKALLEFAVGAAVIVNSQYQLPVLAGSVTLRLGSVLARRIKRRRRSRRVSTTGDREASVELEWSRLSVGITHKKTGQRQQIFRDLDGLAQPGRSNASKACFLCI